MIKNLNSLLDQDFIVNSVDKKSEDTNSKIIKVIGVGGGGSNAVNYMFNKIKDVDFVVCNTDRQALLTSPVPTKIQLGPNLTKGLGAGTDAKNGSDAALESMDDIKSLISGTTQMVFITAGMGGGTGTGAAPIIAKTAKDMGMLTVSVVTAPYSWEGSDKKEQALKGILELQEYSDTVLVVLNEKLEELYEDMKMSQAFAQADNILLNAVKSISEIITTKGNINTDFKDVQKVLKDAGQSVMGMAEAEGDDRASVAIKNALDSPLLNDNEIAGAKRILVTLASSEKNEATMREQRLITNYVLSQIQGDARMFKLGTIFDDSLGDKLRVTIVAAGFKSLKNPIDLPLGTATSGSEDEDSVSEGGPKQEPVLVAADVPLEVVTVSSPPQKELTPTSITFEMPVEVAENEHTYIVDRGITFAEEPEEKGWSAEEYGRLREMVGKFRKVVTDWELLEAPAFLRNKLDLWERPSIPSGEMEQHRLS